METKKIEKPTTPNIIIKVGEVSVHPQHEYYGPMYNPKSKPPTALLDRNRNNQNRMCSADPRIMIEKMEHSNSKGNISDTLQFRTL